jgi:ligand-binding sensor domain-containing protein/signal transduction histidine kinase
MKTPKKTIYLIAASFFLLFCVESLQAYVVRNYSDQNGLSMNIGLSIVQDKMGYIWIAAQNGLNRFDGKDVKIFTKNHGLPDSYITKLFIDKDKNLWIATRGGLARYNYPHGTFTSFNNKENPIDLQVNCLGQSDLHGLLIGTDKGLWKLKNGKLIEIELRQGNEIIHCRITEIAADEKNGIIYLGTPQDGLIIFKDKKATRIKNSGGLIINNIGALLMDGEILWVGTENNLLYYDGNKFKEKTRPGNRNSNKSIKGVWALYKTKKAPKQMLWIGTTDGLFSQKDNIIYRHPASNIFDSNYILCLGEDYESGLWIGTYGGVSYLLPDSKFQTYNQKNGLLQNTVFGIHEDKNNRIWLATYGGITVIDDLKPEDVKIQSFSTSEGLPGNTIRRVTSDNETGDIWIGSFVGGLIKGKVKPGKKHPLNITFKSFSTPGYEFPNNDVRVVFTDSKNRLWIGMRNGGVILFDKKNEKIDKEFSKKTHNVEVGLFNDNVWFISEDSKGNIWAGVDKGLCKITYDDTNKEYNITNYDKGNGLNCTFTQAICEDDNIYWVATYGHGLYCLDESKPKNEMFQQYTIREVLPDNCIYGILKDEKNSGFLWLTTNNGIFLWDKTNKKVIEVFDENDGLPSNENNSLSGYRDSRNRIWFSTSRGAACMELRYIPQNEIQPPVYIEEIIVRDKNKKEVKTQPVEIEGEPSDSKPLTLEHDQNNLYIKFTALSFQFPDAVTFKYKLKNFQDEWEGPKNDRVAEYTNLPPGDYTFEVKAYNNDGVESHTKARYRFLIKKTAFTQRLIFYIGIVMVAFLILYVIFKYRMAQKEKQKQELEGLIKKRNKEINKMQDRLIQQEKMASLGTLVKGVSHELNNPAALIKMTSEFFAEAWKEILPILDEYAWKNTGFEITGLPYNESKKEIENLLTGLLEGSNRIKTIIAELKILSEKEDAQDKKKIDINQVIETSVHLTQSMINKATRQFSCELAYDLPHLCGNFQRLGHVIINLIKNACQALPDNTRGVYISTIYDKENNGVIIHVKDEGAGIEEKDLKYIMDPFFTTKRDIKGIGLGLAISKQIIQDHGGHINFETTPGKGTTVSVYLPVEPLKAGKQLKEVNQWEKDCILNTPYYS